MPNQVERFVKLILLCVALSSSGCCVYVVRESGKSTQNLRCVKLIQLPSGDVGCELRLVKGGSSYLRYAIVQGSELEKAKNQKREQISSVQKRLNPSESSPNSTGKGFDSWDWLYEWVGYAAKVSPGPMVAGCAQLFPNHFESVNATFEDIPVQFKNDFKKLLKGGKHTLPIGLHPDYKTNLEVSFSLPPEHVDIESWWHTPMQALLPVAFAVDVVLYPVWFVINLAMGGGPSHQ